MVNSKKLRQQTWQALLKIQNTPIVTKFTPPKFRTSNLPFCPLLFVLDHHYPKQYDFSSNFFFASGHALHNLWQKFASLALPDNIIANWQCNHVISNKSDNNTKQVIRCNKIYKFCSLTQVKQQACPHGLANVCQQNLHLNYSELALNSDELSAHTDLLYRDNKKRYHLWDFKTTSTFLFDRPELAINKYSYPNKKYIEQLENYVILLEAKYKIKITSYSIVYISRERGLHTTMKPAIYPFTYLVTNKLRNHRRKTLTRYKQQYQIAKNWLTASKKHRDTKELWQARPCHNRKDYLNNMKFAFFDDCPQLEPCLSGKLFNSLRKLPRYNLPKG